jgi:uncharacterized protein YjiS (DUF1127 family)
MEVAMNDTSLVGPAEMPRRHDSLPTLRRIIATWEERKRFRWALEQMSKDNPI